MYMDRYKEAIALLPDVGKGVQDTLDNVGDFSVAHSDALTVVVVIIIASIVMLAALRYTNNRMPVDKAEEMRKRLILDSMYADMIHDGLLDKLHAGEIDKHEYKRACRRFGLAFRLPDLLNRKSKKKGMRFIIRRNITEMHRTPSVAGKLPGPKPGEDVPASFLVLKSVPAKRKVWVMAGKASLRRKSAD